MSTQKKNDNALNIMVFILGVSVLGMVEFLYECKLYTENPECPNCILISLIKGE